MPERQSSPGEVVTRQEAGTDGDASNGSAVRPQPTPRSTVDPAPEAGGPLAEQVAEDVADQPEADQPEAAEPKPGEQPVLTGAAASDLADDEAHPARPSPTLRSPDPGSEAVTAIHPVAGEAAETSVFETSGETTQVIPLAAAGGGPPPNGDRPTDILPVGPGSDPRPPADDPDGGSGGPPPPAAPDDGDTGNGRPRRSRRLLIVAAVVGVLALLYAGDLVLSSGSVPRGVTVVGVPVGGLSQAAAEERLRADIEPRTSRPVAVTVGEVRNEIDPASAGLAVDWQATLDQAGSQPLNPITRLTSFFTEREVGVVTSADAEALATTLEQLGPVVDRPPVEGGVTFDGVTPVPVEPVAGQQLDLPAATEVLQREWASGRTVALPLIELPPTTTSEDVAAAIEDVARPAVSAPVTIIGERDTSAELAPEEIASALSFRADPTEGLVPEINQETVVEAVSPDLAPSERPGRDATLEFSSGTPVVTPSEDGRGVDYDATLADLLTILTGDGPREITAVYADQPAEVTTEDVNELGTSGVIGEFTTGGFASDSGQNIRRAAEVIDGTIVKPGETFSLNAATTPRNAANGYVEAGIIDDGRPGRGIGGGVSQIATTLYNAAYFAGMTDVEHQPHSFYISRYPPGREATVFAGAIDLKFRNDNPTGVLIETVWTPSDVTIRLYGTKRYEVSSAAGSRTNPTQPSEVTIPAGEPCSPSQGAPGFTITDTRTLREISTGETRSETQSTRYNPSPIVVCEG